MRGIVTVRNFVIGTSEKAKRADKLLQNAVNLTPLQYRKAIQALGQPKEQVFYNQIHKVGREVLARLLVGDTTYSGEVNYGALGTNSAVISDTDIALTTEVARKPIASRLRTGDSVTIDFYFSKSDTNGTYEEFGCFIDGTSVVDTGQMFNRVLTGGWAKSATEAMTVSVQFDLNAA